MKKIIYSLFFFLLLTQICFGQWVQVGLNGESIKDIAVQNSNIFAVTSDNGKVYRSIDSGANWTMIVDSNSIDVTISPSGRVLMIHDSLPNIYSWENLYYSLDNGNTWVTSNIHEQIDSMFFYLLELRNITVSPTGIVYCGLRIHIPVYGFDGYFVRSTDDGLSWVLPLYNDPPGWVAQGGQLFNFNFEYVITIGEHSQGGGPPDINLSSDNGNNWAFLGFSPSYNSQGLGLFSNDNIIVGAGDEYFPNTVYISTDMCSTWSIIATVNSQIKVGLSLSSGSEERMLIGTKDLGVFLFSDEGDSLGSRNEGLTNLNVQALTIDNNGYLYAGTGNGIWRRPLFEVIPVELISLTATSNGNNVILNWSTATETNNQGFNIERKSSGSEYSEIGFVPGFGTTTEPKTYSYTDSKVSAGKYSYRLKQIDFDGSYEYSPEVEVEVAAPFEFLLEQNYPNPFNPVTTIGYGIKEKSNVVITILNAVGEEVAMLVNEEKESGFHTVEFNASSLPSGVYFYRLNAGRYIDTKKMILLK